MPFDLEDWNAIQQTVITSLPQVAVGIAVFVLFWVGGLLLRRIVVRMGAVRGIDRDLSRFLGQVSRATMIAVGAVTALGTAGAEVGALVAGLGLTGFALGFALKDIVSNVVAGILIIIYRPFHRDDEIAVASFRGIVKNVDLRYTRLESNGARIFVPNSLLFSNAITVQGPEPAAEPAATT